MAPSITGKCKAESLLEQGVKAQLELRYLRERGTGEIVGQCLQENNAMASLARHAGFVVQAEPDSDTLSLQLRLA